MVGSIPTLGTNYGFIVLTASTSVSKTESWGSNPHGPAICAINSVGRVSVLQTESQWFESTIAHHHGLGRLGIPYSAQLRLLGENEVRDDS